MESKTDCDRLREIAQDEFPRASCCQRCHARPDECMTWVDVNGESFHVCCAVIELAVQFESFSWRMLRRS